MDAKLRKGQFEAQILHSGSLRSQKLSFRNCLLVRKLLHSQSSCCAVAVLGSQAFVFARSYRLPLGQRANTQGAPSTRYLCLFRDGGRRAKAEFILGCILHTAEMATPTIRLPNIYLMALRHSNSGKPSSTSHVGLSFEDAIVEQTGKTSERERRIDLESTSLPLLSFYLLNGQIIQFHPLHQSRRRPQDNWLSALPVPSLSVFVRSSRYRIPPALLQLAPCARQLTILMLMPERDGLRWDV